MLINFSALNGRVGYAVNAATEATPENFALYPNYPNPFNPETKIKYQIPKATEVRLEIYNLLGQRLRTLLNQKQSAGVYSVVWDGKDDLGRNVASGINLYRFKTEEFEKVRKLSLLR